MRLSEFSKRVAEASILAELSPPIELVTRRVRYWTVNGVLPEEGESGKQREYTEDELYFAVVFNSLADMGIPLGAMRAIGGALRDLARGRPDIAIPRPAKALK